MDRLVINIENDEVDMSVYFQSDGFGFEISTNTKGVSCVLTYAEAKNLAKAINETLGNK